jgi:glycogen synthase
MTADAVGGVWAYSVSLARELSRSGIQVKIAVLGPSPSVEQKQQMALLPNVTLAECSGALEWMANPWEDVDASGEWLLALKGEWKPDIVHLGGYSHAALPWGVPTVVVAHSCVLSWWAAVHNETPPAEWAEYARRVRVGLEAASAVIAPSLAMKHALEDHYGLTPERVTVVPNFTDVNGTTKATKQPFCLTAGRLWDKAKNVSLLREVALKGIPWPIRIAGEDEAGKDTEASVVGWERLGALPHSRLMEQMALASIYLHPALYEPFGLSVLEAARAKCCLVLADIPSLRELWQSAAIFLDPNDPDVWTEELNQLTRHPEIVRQMAEAAYARSLKITGEASAAAYIEIYRTLLRNSTPNSTGTVAA